MFSVLVNPLLVLTPTQALAIGLRLSGPGGSRLPWSAVADLLGVARPTAYQHTAKGLRRLDRHGMTAEADRLRPLLYPTHDDPEAGGCTSPGPIAA